MQSMALLWALSFELASQKHLDTHQMKVEAAHNCARALRPEKEVEVIEVGLIAKKWLLGDLNGLKVQVYQAASRVDALRSQVWSKWALKRAEAEKKLQSVHMALSKWVGSQLKD